MRQAKRRRLERRGWTVGSAKDSSLTFTRSHSIRIEHVAQFDLNFSMSGNTQVLSKNDFSGP